MKLKALITQRQILDAHGVAVDVLESSYVDFFSKLNIEIFPISNFTLNPSIVFDTIKPDFIILSGGGDLSNQDSQTSYIQNKRDELEKYLVNNYISKIPILAICRGMQHINLLFNGEVNRLENIDAHRTIGIDHNIKLGETIFQVNNFHNYGFKVNDLASDFNLIAVDEEKDIVEGFYSLNLKVLGIQWHPERPFIEQSNYDKSFELIKEFIIKRGVINESNYIGSRPRNKIEEIY